MAFKQRILPPVLLFLVVCIGLLPLVPSQARPVHGNVNTQVKPGDVAWHPSFVTACEASTQSGKPVLLFQLLGKLDDEFC